MQNIKLSWKQNMFRGGLEMCVHATVLDTGLLASNSLSFSDDVSHSRLLNVFVQGPEKQQVFQMGFAAPRKGDAV